VTEEKNEAFLHRWSRRKHQAEKEKELPAAADKPVPELPPVDKLTPGSDYTGFMHPKVEDALRRVALKKLFNDPHFNIPDPFEPYSGDWNVAETIPPEMLASLNQSKTLLFPPEEKKEEGKPEDKAEDRAQAEQAQAEQAQADPAQAVPAPENQELAKSDEPRRQDA
jgi:hypothetical protein